MLQRIGVGWYLIDIVVVGLRVGWVVGMRYDVGEVVGV